MTNKLPPSGSSSRANTPPPTGATRSKTTKRIKSVAKFLIDPATEFKRQKTKRFDKEVEVEEGRLARVLNAQGQSVLEENLLGPLVDLEPREARDLFSSGK